MKNKIIDLSWTLSSDTPLFPGDPAISIESIRSVPTDGYKITTWKSGMHVGTHLDAPSHFLAHGGDVAGIALEKVVGPATVIVVNAKDSIVSTQAIAKAYREAKRSDADSLDFDGVECQSL
ncbi:MAG: cyclase family protein [Bacillus subtilis]|nr:cyclase family protein [Bacillus subtilis]